MAPRVQSLSYGNFYRLGITLESILRSLNNLLERFHQSYFFYMLAATNRFISIGQYMPSLCLLCGAMLLRALSLWVTLQKDVDDNTDKKESKDKEDPKDKTTDEIDEDKKEDKNEKNEDINKTKHEGKDRKETDISFSIVNMGGNYLLIHLFGYGVMNSPLLFSHIGSMYFDQPSEISVYYGLIATSVLLIFITPFLLKLRSTLTFEELSIVNILLLIELSTACLAIGMHNYPLGLCVAVLYTPLSLIVGVVDSDSRSGFCLFLKRIICLILHPLSVVSLGLIIYSRVLFPEETLLSMIGRGRDAAMQAVMFSIVDSMIYGNWLFNVGATVILPTWLLFWQILCNRVTA
nr:glycosylphosphatidylinositol anchor attachment 1 protein-like [Vanessa tameamea]